MILATEHDYRTWQARFKTDLHFKRWWQFWSNYSWLFLLPIIIYLASYVRDAKLITAMAVAFIFARLILTPILSHLFPKQRPYQEYNFPPTTSIFLSQATKSHNAFPSSHIISITAAAGAMLLIKPFYAIFFLIIAVFTALGRVVLGFHYPKDVIFSLISGLIIGILASLVI